MYRHINKMSVFIVSPLFLVLEPLHLSHILNAIFFKQGVRLFTLRAGPEHFLQTQKGILSVDQNAI